MKLLILYLFIMLAGYFAGSKLRGSERNFKWINAVQLVAIVLLVFTMGGRIGADKSIVASLDSIGLSALVVTILILAGSAGAVFIARKWLGFNKEGLRSDD